MSPLRLSDPPRRGESRVARTKEELSERGDVMVRVPGGGPGNLTLLRSASVLWEFVRWGVAAVAVLGPLPLTPRVPMPVPGWVAAGVVAALLGGLHVLGWVVRRGSRRAAYRAAVGLFAGDLVLVLAMLWFFNRSPSHSHRAFARYSRAAGRASSLDCPERWPRSRSRHPCSCCGTTSRCPSSGSSSPCCSCSAWSPGPRRRCCTRGSASSPPCTRGCSIAPRTTRSPGCPPARC